MCYAPFTCSFPSETKRREQYEENLLNICKHICANSQLINIGLALRRRLPKQNKRLLNLLLYDNDVRQSDTYRAGKSAIEVLHRILVVSRRIFILRMTGGHRRVTSCTSPAVE